MVSTTTWSWTPARAQHSRLKYHVAEAGPPRTLRNRSTVPSPLYGFTTARSRPTATGHADSALNLYHVLARSVLSRAPHRGTNLSTVHACLRPTWTTYVYGNARAHRLSQYLPYRSDRHHAWSAWSAWSSAFRACVFPCCTVRKLRNRSSPTTRRPSAPP